MRNDEELEWEKEHEEQLERKRMLEEERWAWRDEQAERMREVGHRWSDF